MKNRIIATLMVFTLCLTALIPEANSHAASISAKSVTLRKGSIYTLKTSGLVGVVKWKSSNKSVATVKKGKVSAKGPGTTTITARTSAATLKCKVKVKKKSKKKGSKLNPKTLSTSSKKGLTFTHYCEGKKVGKFNIKIKKFAYGNESKNMALRNSSNPVPASDQQYLFFTVQLKYLKGTGSQTVKMSSVFNYYDNIFGAYGAKRLKPINYGFGMGYNENMSTVNISPGNTVTADCAILVEKSYIPVTFRLQTGKKSYTWVKI